MYFKIESSDYSLNIEVDRIAFFRDGSKLRDQSISIEQCESILIPYINYILDTESNLRMDGYLSNDIPRVGVFIMSHIVQARDMAVGTLRLYNVEGEELSEQEKIIFVNEWRSFFQYMKDQRLI